MTERAPRRPRGRIPIPYKPEFSRRAFLRLAGLAAVGATVSGCIGPTRGLTSEGAPERAEGEAPGNAAGAHQESTLVVGMAAASIVTLDPAAYSDRATETVVRNLYDGLVTRTAGASSDVDNQVVPQLAQEYRWVDDRTVEFDLRRGVRFHNGQRLTADDVVFTFERILHQDVGASRRGFVQEVERVEKVRPYRVRFHLKSPWPVFLQMLVHNQIVPEEYVRRVGDAEFARRPVGTGPFKYVSGTLDGQIVLERFADYYGGSEALPPVGPAQLDRVVFRMMPDLSARLEALDAGEAHIIQNVPPSVARELIGAPHVLVKTTVGTRPKFVDLNVTVPPLDDVRVRQALNYAVDASRILAAEALGYGVILRGPLSPANLYADPSLQPYGYDPEVARSLLGQAGYRPEDISFQIDAYGTYVRVAEAVAEQLVQLGMNVTVRPSDYQTLRPQLLNCERQAFLRDWGDSAFDPVGYVEAKWQTRVENTPAGRANYACYSNPTVDELIVAGASEPNPEKRREIYDRMQRLIQQDAPAIFLYVPQEIEACSVRVQNWEPSPDGRINLHDVWLSDAVAAPSQRSGQSAAPGSAAPESAAQ
jgi:peptide/nickel transport system substrate-binding protein